MKVHLRKKKLKSGGYTLLLDYYLSGKRVREYLQIHIGVRDPSAKDKISLADKIRAQRELAFINDNHGFVPSYKKHIDFFAYFQKFIKHTSRKDPRLFIASLNHLKIFYSKPTLPCSLIDHKFCADFRVYLSRNLNGETPFNYFCVFRRVITEAIKDRIFQNNPCAGVINKKPGGHVLGKEILSDSELRTLFSTPCFNDEVKRAFLFCCFTGLRGGDVRELCWRNIDLRNKMFRFSQSKTGGRMYPPLSETAISFLGEEGKPLEKVFHLDTQNGVNKSLKAWVAKAGIKKHITFHCARHTFATSLLVHGADLKTTSELMGHTTTRETEKYTHISEKMKRKAVDALPRLV